MAANITVTKVFPGERNRRYVMNVNYNGKTAVVTLFPDAPMTEDEDDNDVLRREILSLVEAFLGWSSSRDEIVWKQ